VRLLCVSVLLLRLALSADRGLLAWCDEDDDEVVRRLLWELESSVERRLLRELESSGLRDRWLLRLDSSS
jgi:hypothetical protein